MPATPKQFPADLLLLLFKARAAADVDCSRLPVWVGCQGVESTGAEGRIPAPFQLGAFRKSPLTHPQ